MLDNSAQQCEPRISRETLSRLLFPLGIKLEKTGPFWTLMLIDNPIRVQAMPSAIGIYEAFWNSIEDLVEDMREYIHTFIAFDDSVSMLNPYLGCKSLEEMKIRADLHFENYRI